MRPVLTLLFYCFIASSFGQTNIPVFGSVSSEERNLKECSFDKSADAIVLLDYAQSTHDEEHALITTRRLKIKILKEGGLEEGNIIITYQHANGYEEISEIEGFVHTTDGNGVPFTVPLDKKAIYRNKIDEFFSEVKIALPNIKVGTIFEYSYTSRQKSWGNIRDWRFQRNLPTLYSKYDLTILPGAAFQYKIFKSPLIAIEVKSPQGEGKISFAMANIPGLREEPYMDAPGYYIQRVEFQIAEYVTSYGARQKTMTTWEALSRELLIDARFGRAIEKNLGKDIDILKEVSSYPSELQKMKSIHNYVRKNFSWNRVRSFYAIDGIKRVWDRKSGTNGEINLTLINLLKDAGLNVNPLLVCYRDYGKVSADYPFLEQFSEVVAHLVIDGKTYIINGIDLLTPSEMIPFNLLNTNAFLLTKKNPTMITIKDDQRFLKSNLNASCELGTDGVIKGTVFASNYDYSRLNRTSYYKKEGKDKFTEGYLMRDGTDLTVDSLLVNNLEIDSLPLEQRYNFTVSTTANGDYRMVNLDLFFPFNKNPFLSDIRFTNIDFGSQMFHAVTQQIKIPPGLKLESLPKALTLVMPDNSIKLSRTSSYDDKTNTILIRQGLEIKRPVFTADEYPAVKEFFKKMMDLLNEPLILKSK